MSPALFLSPALLASLGPHWALPASLACATHASCTYYILHTKFCTAPLPTSPSAPDAPSWRRHHVARHVPSREREPLTASPFLSFLHKTHTHLFITLHPRPLVSNCFSCDWGSILVSPREFLNPLHPLHPPLWTSPDPAYRGRSG